jgi:hypothetical protein
MIDPLLSLVFALHSNPGVYALLLGSGISRAAEIPTGWEVVLDLVRKLARLEEEDCEPEPDQWYRNRFGEEPDYSKLLDQLAHSRAERSQLLRSYFEPDEDGRQRGAKLPTPAHKSIAKLVADGLIRIIITTNFDRLLEQALEEVGVAPFVIATPDAAEGAMPLAHSRCTVVKVHGDYLDTRIKNTPGELAKYDKRVNKLLDQVFDEYGLIICGWSGEWDSALIATLERCKSRRFTTYWAAYQGQVGDKASSLIALRKAEVINIESADDFFGKLSEKATALKEYDKHHPLSAKLAVASLKRYIAEDRYRIPLHDLVAEETEHVRHAISDEHFPNNSPVNSQELIDRVRRYESAIEILQALMIYGCFWGNEEHQYLWTQTLQRVANANKRTSGLKVWLNLKLYPALLLLYSGGIAALVGGRYDTFHALLFKPSIRDLNEEHPLISRLSTWEVMENGVQERLPGKERHYTPLSDYLVEHLRAPLKEILPDNDDYERSFDLFEYLFYMLYVDATYTEIDEEGGPFRGPVGRFYWRCFERGESRIHYITDKIDNEVAESGQDWGLLKVGCFNGSPDRYKKVRRAIDNSFVRGSAGTW